METTKRLEWLLGVAIIIGGYHYNSVTPMVRGATIGGGGASLVINRVTDNYGTIAGGGNNQAGDNAGSTDDATYATVSGGTANQAGAESSTVGGGYGNVAEGTAATVGGGTGNVASGEYASVDGGWGNTANARMAVVGGGVGNLASALYSTIAGGNGNSAGAEYATVGGGAGNYARGYYATVPGGFLNYADGHYSLAAGRQAKANHDGTFVWADATEEDFSSTAADQFLIRANGGVGIGTDAPGGPLHVLDELASGDRPAIYGEHAVTDYYGIGVKGVGGGSGTNYGVYGYAAGGIAHYGGYFDASASDPDDLACGVFGTVHSGNTNEPTYGGNFYSDGVKGHGAYGVATSTEEVWNGEFLQYSYYGVSGRATGPSGVGVSGGAWEVGGIGVHGYALSDATDAAIFDGDVTVNGNFLATGGSKEFVQPHPTDPAKEIVYVCLEGGENGVYVRGTGQLSSGQMEIELPKHFALVATEEGITAQVTPIEDCRGLFVVEKNPRRIVVRESQGGTSDTRFDYLVMGVRRGYEEHEVIRENRHVRPHWTVSQEDYEERLARPENRGTQLLLIENGTLKPDGTINLETAETLGWKLGPKTRAEQLEWLTPPEG
ncbi:MAG: hypothetical protein KAV82_11365 [Phycisphaerae bacterium]|nr:hypothetical protein [Phycisphaerae bacterium]